MKLFGFIYPEKKVQDIERILDKMAETLKTYLSIEHIFSDEGVGIGHVSIDDWNKNQPTFSNDDNLCLMFCGKIYGYEALKDLLFKKGYFLDECSDAEFILWSFKEYGKDFVKFLNGIFVIIIWNREKRELLILNDRYGMKPFYYYHDEEKFIFASEIKALIASDELKKEINWDSWRDVFSYGFVIGQKTFFKHVFSLPNACILSFRENSVRINSYWNYGDIKIQDEQSEEYLVNRGSTLLKKSVLEQIKGIKAVQVPLSGGYDSRAIACVLNYFTNIPFKTLTGIKNSSERGIIDAKYAKLLSNKINFKNIQILDNKNLYEKHFVDFVYSMDALSCEHLWFMPLAEEIETGVVSFDGIAAGVLFRACFFQGENMRTFDRKKTSSILHANLNINSGLHFFFRSDILAKIRPTNESISREIKNIEQTIDPFTVFILKNRTKNSISLIPNNVVSNAPTLFPFLDNELVQLAISIPVKIKLCNQIYLKILKKSFPEAMEVPTTNDVNDTDESVQPINKIRNLKFVKECFRKIMNMVLFRFNLIRILDKLNLGFSEILEFKLHGKNMSLSGAPTEKEDLRFLEILISNIEAPPFIRKDYLSRQIASHRYAKKNYGYFLVPIASFYLWYNLFFKELPDGPEQIKRKLAENSS
jgi:asparagine synthase (glutamine-hydrolysing)